MIISNGEYPTITQEFVIADYPADNAREFLANDIQYFFRKLPALNATPEAPKAAPADRVEQIKYHQQEIDKHLDELTKLRNIPTE